jgi:DNA-directed RNA polymerase subunit M/transcription elongation factor TFIIS
MTHQDNTYNTYSVIKDINHFDLKREYFSFFDFKTNHSKDFDINMVKMLVANVNRSDSRKKLIHYVKYFVIAEQIEKGIFESTLSISTRYKVLPQLSPNIYEAKLNDICKNLDVNDIHIENKTLLSSVMEFKIYPFYVAYLAPHQLHPERWATELEKKIEKMNTETEIITSDLYACIDCGSRKCKTSQEQLRGADEGFAIKITCTVCHKTHVVSN